jgi:hypothetical protein
MRPDYRSIDDGANLIVLELQLLEDELPNAPIRPVGKPIVDRLPRAKALGQVPPWNACFRAVKDRVDEMSIADLRLGALPLLRQQLAKPGPLLIG